MQELSSLHPVSELYLADADRIHSSDRTVTGGQVAAIN